MCLLSHPPPADLTAEESAVPEGSTPDDAETDTKAPDDEGDQLPATESVAGALTPDSPESPSGEDEVEGAARAVEAVAEPVVVVESTDTVGEVVVSVERDEAAAGE